MRNAEIQTWELLNAGENMRRLREMFVQSPSFSALLQGPDHRFVLTNPAYQQLIGHRDVIGLTVRDAVPEAERQGFTALLDRVFATGEAFVGKDVEIVLQRSAEGPEEKRYLDFVYQPIKDEEGAVISIFVEGDRHHRPAPFGEGASGFRGPPAPTERGSGTPGDRTRTSPWFDVEAEPRPAWGAQFEGILRDGQSGVGERPGLDGRGGR